MVVRAWRAFAMEGGALSPTCGLTSSTPSIIRTIAPTSISKAEPHQYTRTISNMVRVSSQSQTETPWLTHIASPVRLTTVFLLPRDAREAAKVPPRNVEGKGPSGSYMYGPCLLLRPTRTPWYIHTTSKTLRCLSQIEAPNQARTDIMLTLLNPPFVSQI